MAISYLGASTAYAVANNPTDPAWPSGHAAGDFGLLLVATANQPMAAPSGWTQIGSSFGVGTPGATSGAIAVQAFYAWATSSSESPPAVPDTGNLTICQLHAYRGVDQTTPIDVAKATFSDIGTTITLSSTTVATDNTRIIAHIASDYAAASTTIYKSTSSGNILSWSESFDAGTTAGVGGSSAAYTGDLAESPTGDLTFSIPSSSTWVGVIIALRPATVNPSFAIEGAATLSLMARLLATASASFSGTSDVSLHGSFDSEKRIHISGSSAANFTSSSLVKTALSAYCASTFTPKLAFLLRADGMSACAINTAAIQRFAPQRLFSQSYTADETSITFPISSQAGLDQEQADAVTGDWRAIFQAMLSTAHAYLVSLGAANPIAPRTVKIFTLEDWNRNDARFGRHMKRLFLIEFIVENSSITVFNSGE